MREHYQALIDNPAQMDKILLAGADKARQLATPFMREVRHAVGLRALSSGATAPVAKEAKAAVPSFKQYREKDGQFYFKLVDAQGQPLLQSLGFASPKEAAQTMARLQTEGVACLSALSAQLEPRTAQTETLLTQALDYLVNSKKNHLNNFSTTLAINIAKTHNQVYP
jgi:tryptophanyl-tRNA synthetase